MKTKIDAANPSLTHLFIRNLNSRGKLLRWYTQNIDGLEWKALCQETQHGSMALIPDARIITEDTKVIRLHGDIKLVQFTLRSIPHTVIPRLTGSKVLLHALVVEKGSLVGLNIWKTSKMVLPVDVLIARLSVGGVIIWNTI
jgi:hypothetical protein